MRPELRWLAMLVVLVVAIGVMVQTSPAPDRSVSADAHGEVSLTASSPQAAVRVRMTLPTAGQQVATSAFVQLDAPASPSEPAAIAVVRSSDGRDLELRPFAAGGFLARSFVPFESCGPSPCTDDFTVTFRLTGSDIGTVRWQVAAIADFPGTVPASVRPSVEVLP